MAETDPNAVAQTEAIGSDPTIDTEAEIARAATLDAITYDREREAIAKRIGVRVSTFDDEVRRRREVKATAQAEGLIVPVEPWPDPVDGEVLLDAICRSIESYIVCTPETRIAASLWIAFTWFVDVVDVAPLAVITSPEKRCGKTQLLDLMGRLVCRPLTASNISPAAVYRVIEQHQPTLLIDEADTFLRDNEAFRGIVNSGHTRGGAYVIRTVGDDHEPKRFSTWGAKILCGIGKLHGTLMDRAIVLELRRKLPSEKVGRLRHADPALFEEAARKLARFARDNVYAVQGARPLLLEALNDRAQDNWEPLLAIADLAGGDWPANARRAALKISGQDDQALSTGEQLLADIRKVFDESGDDRMWMKSLVERLCADELAPWGACSRGQPMDGRWLGKRLGEYGIRARSVRIRGESQKGFERSQFEDAWDSYVFSNAEVYPPVTRSHANEINELSVAEGRLDVCENYPPVTPNPLK